MIAFLHKTNCPEEGKPKQKCSSVEKIYSNPDANYRDIAVVNDMHKFPLLQTIREPFLNRLIEEIASYFPSSHLKDFDIFVPMSIPQTEASARLYGLEEISNIYEFFEWEDCSRLVDDWQQLLVSVVKHNKFCEIRTSETTALAFWSQLLKWNEIA